MSDGIHITDVTLRDGLQMESQVISLEKKYTLFQALEKCGYSRIELTSFVHPKWIPQLADSESLCEKIFSGPVSKNIEWMTFVPNEKGLERWLKFPIPWAGLFVATSETFNQKNVNRSRKETLEALAGLGARVKKEGRKWRVYISTVFGCPYEGVHNEEDTLSVLQNVAALEPDEIALSDTIGVAVPTQMKSILSGFSSMYPVEKTALHLHNTYGLAASCAAVAYDMGIRRFDGSTGGVGGCPYAKGASGNVPVEELLYQFFRQGQIPKPDFSEMLKAVGVLDKDVGVTVHSRLYEIVKRGGAIYGI